MPPEGRALNSLGVAASLLKFDRQEEGRRGFNSFRLEASDVGAARSYVVGPESEPGSVCFAAEKVEIMLPHKEPGIINWIGGAGHIVIGNRDCDCGWRTDRAAPRWIRKSDLERLWSFDVDVVTDQNLDVLRRFARAELNCAVTKRVIGFLFGGAISCFELDAADA